jgi:hypothetical protein
MNELENIHYVAERFIKDYKAEQDAVYTTAAIERGMLQVNLVRHNAPEYFCGFKGGNTERPVWSHDIKYAKSIDIAQLHLYLERWREGYVFPIWSGVKHEKAAS